jgi:hypothetical protein
VLERRYDAGFASWAAKEGREVRNCNKVSALGARRKTAHRHVINHTLAQWADGCVRHNKLLSLGLRCKTSKSYRQAVRHVIVPTLSNLLLPR